MIICIIEFETKPGMEEEAQKWLAELMPLVEQFSGFQGKESYAHISGDGRVNTVSCWEDEKSLSAWTQDPTHKKRWQQAKTVFFPVTVLGFVQNCGVMNTKPNSNIQL